MKSNRMNHKKLFLAAVIFIFLTISAWAQTNEPPVLTPGGQTTVKEQGILTLYVGAVDPEGDPLTYSWTITSDPTGKAFFRLPGGIDGGTTVTDTNAPTLGMPGGPSYPNPSYAGQLLEVTATVSDGVNQATQVFPITVSGVNQEPVIVVDRSQLGTPTNPRKPPEGIGVYAGASYDPDAPQEDVKMIWRVAKIVGQTCLNNADIVLLGKETDNPGIVVPPNRGTLGSPIEITFELILEDGLIFKQLPFVGYMYDPAGCNGGGGSGVNTPPVVSLSATTTHAAFGQTVTLTGNVTDPGDTHTYSWLQLDTTGGSAVTLSNPTGRITSFTAPSVAGFLRFRFTATDSAGQSASQTINVQVSQTGGGSGGSGGGGGGLGNGNAAGTPSGTATGQLVCSGLAAANNQPAIATVPATFTIEGGNRASITASNGVDPDNTRVNVSGFEIVGAVTYLWTVADGGGFLSNSDLTGAATNVVSFGTPLTSTQRTARLNVLVADGLGCGTSYPVNLVVQPSQTQPNNNAPNARLQYTVQGTSQQGEAPASTISLAAPASIVLNAGGSSDPDGDTLTYTWNLQSGGGLTGVTLSEGQTSRTLTAVAGAVGTATVTVTVSDGKGGTVTRTLTFQFIPPTDKPVQAVAVAMRNGNELNGAVGPGQVVLLSGAQSDIVEGTPSERANLTYLWEQVSGPTAFGRNLKQRDAEILVHDLTQIASVTYRLTVRNGTASATDTVTITVDPSLADPEGEAATGDLYFARVGFGPVGDLEFQTVLVVDNLESQPVEDLLIEFFGADGAPLDVRYLDTDGAQPELRAWDRAQPLSLDGNSSRVLEFRALEGAPLTVGWAKVTSSGSLRGSVRFQLLDGAGSFLSDVGIQSSALGSEFQAAFRVKDQLAFAVSNPGTQSVRVVVSVADRFDNGFKVEKSITLAPGAHDARFLSDFIPVDQFLSEGTLTLKADNGAAIVPTVLITRGQLAVSSQSFARIR